MWNGLGKTAKSFSWAPRYYDEEAMQEGFEASYTYTEADDLEDALLFPLKGSDDMANDLFRRDPNSMEIFERQTIDIRKFAADLDTDEKSTTYDEPMASDGEFDMESDLDDEEVGSLEDDDENEDREDEDEDGDEDKDWDEDIGSGDEFSTAEEQDALDKTIDVLTAQMEKSRISEPEYFLPILRDLSSAKDISDVIKNDLVNLMHALKNVLKCQQVYDHSPAGMEADFLRHIDRQKSRGTG
jgi:hypothetical protein